MAEKKLGTFLGVFTPTILTILGVIMYLRFGWLVGHLGLMRVIFIVLLANSITLMTTLSFSAVATNARVGVGGAYFIISRSLGLEIGGSIGVPLFLSQAFSVTLYAYGLAESLRIVWPHLPLQAVTLVIVLAVGLLAVLGADKALRAQVGLMALVAISIAALAIGAVTKTSGATVMIHPPSGEVPFWAGFAVFFPAVTGIMAGLGLSGYLKDPGRAIPLGSIMAVLTGLTFYLAIPFLLAVGATQGDLRNEPLVWSRVAVLGPWLVLPGLWAAIFSSAVGSILGAPRTLQALARDGLAPRFLGRRTGDWQEILPGLLVSVIIALAAVFLGNLNAVATVVSMFFLTVYGTVNLVAAFEILSGDPSWRPKIHTHWIVNLLGAAACVVVMFLINPIAGIAAIVAEITLWLWLSRTVQKARWGDARRGLYENLIRWALIHLAKRPLSARNWRPHILVFVDEPVRELDLIRFGNWFSQKRGVVTVCHLVVGDIPNESIDIARKREEMQVALDMEDLVVFAEVDVVNEVVDGIVHVTQANGMAGLSSNTVMLGWPSDPALRNEFILAMRKLEFLNKSLIIGRIHPKHLFRRENIEQTIHVWWGGLERNGDLMLLLAHLLKRNPFWHHARIKIMSIATSETAKTRTESHLTRLMPEFRIEADLNVIIKPKEFSVSQIIQKESANADVVFLGLATPELGQENEYAERLENLAGDLPAVFFVKNSSLFIGELLESPEEEFEAESEGQGEAVEQKNKKSSASVMNK